MSAAEEDWFERLPPEEQDNLHTLARDSILQLDCYPRRNAEIAAELLAWKTLEVDVLHAHNEWLDSTKAKFEGRGVEWTVENLNRYSRLWEVE